MKACTAVINTSGRQFVNSSKKHVWGHVSVVSIKLIKSRMSWILSTHTSWGEGKLPTVGSMAVNLCRRTMSGKETNKSYHLNCFHPFEYKTCRHLNLHLLFGASQETTDGQFMMERNSATTPYNRSLNPYTNHAVAWKTNQIQFK